MIKVVFFAALREQLNCAELSFAFDKEQPQPITIEQLKQALVKQHPTWQDFLGKSNILSAINHNMVTHDTLINADDEVAFFPPVTGG